MHRGADVPAIVETAPTGNPTDDAIIELAKSVHQIKQGVANLPTDTAPTSNDSTAERIAYRKVERITFELQSPDFFSGGKTLSFGLAKDVLFKESFPSFGEPTGTVPYRRVIRLVGDYGDAISPSEITLEAGDSMGDKSFTMHQYVPEVTIEGIAFGDSIILETEKTSEIWDWEEIPS